MHALDAALASPRGNGTFGAAPRAAPRELRRPLLPAAPWHMHAHAAELGPSGEVMLPLGCPTPAANAPSTEFELFTGGPAGLAPADRDYKGGEYSPAQYLTPSLVQGTLAPELTANEDARGTPAVALPYHVTDDSRIDPLPITLPRLGRFLALGAATSPPAPLSTAGEGRTLNGNQTWLARAVFWRTRADRLAHIYRLSGVLPEQPGVRPWTPSPGDLPPALPAAFSKAPGPDVDVDVLVAGALAIFDAVRDAPLSVWYAVVLAPIWAALTGADDARAWTPEQAAALARAVILAAEDGIPDAEVEALDEALPGFGLGARSRSTCAPARTRPDRRAPRWALFLHHFLLDAPDATDILTRDLFSPAIAVANAVEELPKGQKDGPCEAIPASDLEEIASSLSAAQTLVRTLQYFAPVPLPASAYPDVSAATLSNIVRALVDPTTAPALARAMRTADEVRKHEADLPDGKNTSDAAQSAIAARAAKRAAAPAAVRTVSAEGADVGSAAGVNAADAEANAEALADAEVEVDAEVRDIMAHMGRLAATAVPNQDEGKDAAPRRFPVTRSAAARTQRCLVLLTARWCAHALAMAMTVAHFGRWVASGPGPCDQLLVSEEDVVGGAVASEDFAAAQAETRLSTTIARIRARGLELRRAARIILINPPVVLSAGDTNDPRAPSGMALPSPSLSLSIEALLVLTVHPNDRVARAATWAAAEVLETDSTETFLGSEALAPPLSAATAAVSARSTTGQAEDTVFLSQQLVFRPKVGLIVQLFELIGYASRRLRLEPRMRLVRLMDIFTDIRWQTTFMMYIATSASRPYARALAGLTADPSCDSGAAAAGSTAPATMDSGADVLETCLSLAKSSYAVGDGSVASAVPAPGAAAVYGTSLADSSFGGQFSTFMHRTFRAIAVTAQPTTAIFPILGQNDKVRFMSDMIELLEANDALENPAPVPYLTSTIRTMCVGVAAADLIKLVDQGSQKGGATASAGTVLAIPLKSVFQLANSATHRAARAAVAPGADAEAGDLVDALAAIISTAPNVPIETLATSGSKWSKLWGAITALLEDGSAGHERVNAAAWNLVYALCRYRGAAAANLLRVPATCGTRKSVLDIAFSSANHRTIGNAFQTFGRVLRLARAEAAAGPSGAPTTINPSSPATDQAALMAQMAAASAMGSVTAVATNKIFISVNTDADAQVAPYGPVRGDTNRRPMVLVKIFIDYMATVPKAGEQKQKRKQKQDEIDAEMWAGLLGLSRALLPAEDADSWRRGFAFTKLASFLGLLVPELPPLQRAALERLARAKRDLGEILRQAGL